VAIVALPIPGLQRRLFDHIDLRIRNRARAQEFFAKVLPAIGFSLDKWGAFEKDGAGKPSEFFGFTEDANHRPNDTRIAFWAETREQVDRVAQVVREAGGRNLEGLQIWPEYSAGYYALFFEDPDGNKLEICCRGSAIVAE
jgi:catechol 2,3-dioxygenase-like lactoylglutathione lyase family enzyme